MPGPRAAGELLLETRGLTKVFGTLRASDGVDLEVRAGEVHALLGENGAGKSTLMKMLYGYHQPTAGEIRLGGRAVRLSSPRQGRAHGIGMVFQSFTLIPALEVWENVALFLDGQRSSREQLLARIEEVSRSYGLELDPRALVRDLPFGTRQKVEIVKVLLTGARILIFDEPTSVLAPHEAEALFRVFDRLRGEGYAVVFITHKMAEVLRCADRITVLRRGRVARTLPATGATRELLATLLVGEGGPSASAVELADDRPRGADGRTARAPVLRFEGVGCPGDLGRPGLSGLDFSLQPGEVLGIAAVSGNGQEYLADLVLGLRPLTEGRILLHGQVLEPRTPRSALSRGVACIPEDPLRMGAIAGLSVRENLILGGHRPYWTAGGWVPDRARLDRAAGAALTTAFVQAPPPLDARAGDLSGGNLHRVLIARELARNPALLISYYLTRGLDLSNARAARDLVLAHTAGRGMALLFISEDLDELFTLSDRILVLHAGRARGVFRPADTTLRDVGLLMTGADHARA